MQGDEEGYTVRVIDLPVTVHGMIAVDETGHANIYINARLSIAMQREALKHELKHYANGDIYSSKSIREVEGFAP